MASFENNTHLSIGTDVTVDGPGGRKGQVRGVQMLEPPLAYLVRWSDGGNEWVDAARVTVAVVKATKPKAKAKKAA